MLEGLKLEYVDVGELTLHVRHGGARQPVAPSGHPRAHTTSHLAEGTHPGANPFVSSTGPVFACATATTQEAPGAGHEFGELQGSRRLGGRVSLLSQAAFPSPGPGLWLGRG